MTTNSLSINPAGQKEGIVLQGYHKKLKTMKKKYFVLYSDIGVNLAKLEYYDTEKKFKSRSNPKRTIILRNCVNIHRRLDTKQKFVIALSTIDDVFCIVLDTEQELNTWLRAMLALQRGEDTESDPPKPTFEHVWQVQVQRKGLAEEKGIIGSYYVCLTTKSLTLVRIGARTTSLGEERLASVVFYLTTIRRCGDSQCFFYMEVGRHSAIGAGALWMETEDALIAQNMHTIIYNAMSSTVKPRDENFGGPMRRRSASANEASKPISMMQRRQTHSSNKPMNSSPLGESTCKATTSSNVSSAASSTASTLVEVPIAVQSTVKPRELSPTAIDSFNSLKANQQTDTVDQQTVLPTSSSTRLPSVLTSTSCNPQYPFTAPLKPLESQRRHSVSAVTAVCHQRALSLPNGDPISNNAITEISNCNAIIKKLQIDSCTSSIIVPTNISTMNTNENNTSNDIRTKPTSSVLSYNICHEIQPIHQRTRSLPITGDTAIVTNDTDIISSKGKNEKNWRSSNFFNVPFKIQCQSSSPNHIYKGTLNDSIVTLTTNITNPSLPNFNFTNINNTSSTNKHSTNSKFGNATSCCKITSEMNNNSNRSRNSKSDADILAIRNNNNNIVGRGNKSQTTSFSEHIAKDSEILLEAHSGSNPVQNFVLKNLNGKHQKSSSFNHGGNKSSVSGGSPLLLRKGRVRTPRSTTLGRERCDSLPSRNRTASECSNQSFHSTSMAPPRSVTGLSNRPHSMYNNRHSHSPPMNPLSPSAGYSGSDGSLSTDETDSFGHPLTPDESGNFMRYYNPCGSDAVIPEENTDDFWFQENKCNSNDVTVNQSKHVNPNSGLSLPISNSNASRKGSPAAHLGSIESQGQYMDMYSPCGSSPCEQTGSGYLPISPGVEYSRGLYPGSSGGHSRASSLAEETVDGYVPMAPLQSQDFTDVEHSFIKQHHQMSSVSSAASSCSITSGTPSTDLRFAEYPLDKVKSRFTPDDEDVNSPNNRPLRAYSVGSRLEHNKRKLRVDMISMDQNNSRERAFSVGSKTKVPRSELFRGIFASSLMSCNVTNNNITVCSTENNTPVGKGKKSSSAPILVHKSHTSVDRMGDLMEIDFSKNAEEQSNSNSPKYSNMRISSFPVSVPSARPKYDSHYSSGSPRSYAVAGYMDMKPGSLSDKFSPTIAQKSIDSGYLEMRPIGLAKSPSLSSSPVKTSLQNSFKSNTSPINIQKQTDNMNMSLNNSNSRRISSEDYLNASPDNQFTNKVLEIDDVQTPTSTNKDGYIEMCWQNAKESMEDKENQKTKSFPTSNNEQRQVSLPIDIVGMLKNKNSHSGPEIDTFAEELKNKVEEGEPSMSQSTIFLFSPGSPKTFASASSDFTQRKCLVDATSGTVTLENEDKNTNVGDVSTKPNNVNINNNITSKELCITLEAKQNAAKDTFAKNSNLEALSQNYANLTLDPASENGAKNNIVRCPDNTRYDSESICCMDKQNSEFSANVATPIKPILSSNKKSFKSAGHVVVNEKSNNNLKGFKPISSKIDEMLMKTINSPNSTKTISSPKSTISNYLGNGSEKLKNEDSSGYELLQMRSESSLPSKRNLSRPSSVNSEKISPSKNIGRPNSANSELLPSVSTSSSTSTLCGGSSSSSSTLCGSKSQSPLSTSRPHSFSDSTGVSRPDSVVSIADQIVSSRPPSVSSERELHYASLVLPPSSNNELSTRCLSNSSSNTKVNSSASGESSSPSPSANGFQQQTTFTYAQIDFNKT